MSSPSSRHLQASILFLLVAKYATAQSNPNPILACSFTSNNHCGPTVACGPSNAGFHGTGFAASNNLTYAGCATGDSGNDCSNSAITSGVGNGCGQCWHLQPQTNYFSNPGKTVGTSVVVKINDQCTDPSYCDQTLERPLNTGYGKQAHFDLCEDSGVSAQFFGEIGVGVVMGLAQLLPDCSALDNGPYGSGLGKLDGSSAGSASGSGVRGAAKKAAAVVNDNPKLVVAPANPSTTLAAVDISRTAAPPTVPTTPTTLVAVVSSSTPRLSASPSLTTAASSALQNAGDSGSNGQKEAKDVGNDEEEDDCVTEEL